ncbi:hypothetical protein ACFQZ2_00275 [Streptomonospora algeriensis]|uniref:TauD/TfdA-like domain-containing protein n=1 Tax=Streptomonospora algeriensis TaxID=995084 RepID=A0ABW3B9Y6_9ACTN
MRELLRDKVSVFLKALQKEWRTEDLDSLPGSAGEPAAELPRVKIADPAALTEDEIDALGEAFGSRFGMVAFECERTTSADGVHPLVRLGEQIRDVVPTRWAITNPSDGPDGTVKIHDVGTPQTSRSLTSLGMAAHQDGWLSMRGVLSVTGLWTDEAPLRAACTYGQNIVRLALDLRREDEEAFQSLFMDDAVTVRRLMDGAVVATSPVLYSKNGWTYSFFREPNDEYEIASGSQSAAASRAVDFLVSRSYFGSEGSAYTKLDRPGRGLIFNNRHCVHGRTAFTDDDPAGKKRIIASKWWVSDPEYRTLVWE